ncbi:hypothetical protein D3C72_1261750 [compost metagenome]
MPNASSRAFCTSTVSRAASTGKRGPYGLPVAASMLAGPVLTTVADARLGLANASVAMTKNRSVSIGRPAPMIVSQ